MIARLFGAAIRGLMMACLVLAPSVILPTVTPDTARMVALAAAFSFVLTTTEYFAVSPCLMEFRDAPPFNRIRFAALLSAVLALSLIASHPSEPSALTGVLSALGGLVGGLLDLPFSPLRAAVLLLTQGAPLETVETLRAAFGMAVLIFSVALAVYIVQTHRCIWPNHGGFNLWVNLPTFDPTRADDIVERLLRNGHITIGAGVLLLFALPMVLGREQGLFGALTLDHPQAVVWGVTVWVGLPFSLVMRGVAMQRIARMFALRRHRATHVRVGLVPL